ncbi:MAG: hypothetical protein GW748_07615 [Alphaproteobacteria bacterium]|nr:hypothetical protein [Alphaproteobacteria bacterium]NCQ67593.1 hypothetical protein [Alphaproteobacteria bacterium]NCT08365.1 hypothetical protein [Alphaproteobacteria bacterium]
MNELVKQFLPDLTWAIFWAFLIGLILLILAGVLLIKNIRTYSREKAARGHGNVPGEKKSLKDYATKTKGFFTRFKDMSLNLRKKYVGDMRDETAQSFQRAIEVLQGYFGPKDAQYHLPWYMVIGCDGSGKSTFLDGAQLELPIGDPVNEITSDLSPVSWKFFDQAVVADVRGDLLLGEKGVNSDEGQWSYILNLFKFYRPKRPIDGIILTIPADEVAGENRFSKDDISARGRAIYAKLWKLQNTLGMRVPVYIVITKSDKIPGFSSLVAQLPENKRQEMLGWSSPYDIHMAFTEEWIETIFRGLRKGFNRLRASIFTRDLIDERRIGNALLPIELASMKETLGLYILTMFKESSYHDSFFLRGVYFTGLGDNQDVINFLQQQQASGSSEQNSNPELGKLVFVSDILSQKVFQEYPICEPNTRLLVSTNKALNTAKVAGSVLAFIWFVGLLNSYQRLKITNQNLFPSLSLINDSIVGANERMSGGNRSKLEKYLNVQSEKVMAEFVEIEAVDSYSIFIPASWFSLVDEKIERSFTSAYDKVILPSISGALKMRIANIVARDSGVQPAAQSKDPFPNPTSSPSFERLERFTQEIADLESHISSFNRLKSSTSVHDLGRLTKYLFNRSLPQQFFSNSDYYRQALGDIFGEKIVFDQHSQAAQEKLRLLYRNFLIEVLDVKENLPVLIDLQKELDAIVNYSAYKRMDEKDLRQLAEKAISFADLAISGKIAWLSKQLFDPGNRYDTVMDHVFGSQLLGQRIASDLSRIANLAFSKYRLALADMKSELVGSFFTVENGQLISEPSSGVINFIDSLTSFLGESFMAPVDNYEILFKIPPAKLLFWDDATLNRGVKVVNAYEDFTAKRLINYSPALHDFFREVGRNSVRKKVVNYVSLSQNYHSEPTTMTSFGARELLAKQVSNIAVATPLFSKVLGVFDDGSFVMTTANLRELLINQNYGVLKKIDNLLAIDNLYKANEEELRWWKGEELVGFKLFNVSDGNDMSAYLTAQRFSITFLANEMAKPILGMLAQPFLSNIPMDMPLVVKWSRILSVLESYEKKTPGNSLQVLEQFLSSDLNSISLANCLEKIGDFDKFGKTGDYFLDVRNHYYEAVEKQCEAVGFKDAVEKYNKAGAFFNANLAGRFPFTKEIGDGKGPEANPDDVATFFKLFDSITSQQLEMLKHSARNAGAQVSIGKFIKDIVSIRPIMLSAIDSDNKEHISKVNLLASFRTDQSREQGGESIIDWSMRIANSVTTMRNNTPIIEWRVGMPIDMMIKWAKNGETVPLPDPRLSKLNVLGNHAVFSYDGRWALARLLREHVLPESAFDTDGVPGSQVLEFSIPTAFNPNCYRGKTVMPFERKSEPARLYMRLIMGTPVQVEPGKDGAAPTGEDKNRIFPVPSFPYYSPQYQRR